MITKASCYDSVTDLEPSEWSRLTADLEAEYSPDYQRYLEAQEGRFRPVLVVRDGDGTALAGCGMAEIGPGTTFASRPLELITDRQTTPTGPDGEEGLVGELREVLERHGAQVGEGDLDHVLRVGRRTLTALLGVPLIVRAMWDSRLLVAAGLDDAARMRVMAYTVQAVKAEAARRGYRSVAFMYVPDEDPLLSRLLGAAGFHQALVRCIAELDLSADASYEDYLNRFRARARSELKTEARRFGTTGLTLRTFDPQEYGPRMAELESLNSRKYGRELSIAGLTAVHADLRATIGPRLIAFGAFSGDELVCSHLTMRGHRRLYSLTYGADYERIAGLPGVYASVVFYEPIRYAIAHGYHTLGLSVLGYEAKLLRGAALHDRRLFLWTVDVSGAALCADWLAVVDAHNERHFADLRTRYRHRFKPKLIDL